MTGDSAPDDPTSDLDAVVDAVLLSSRALVAVSARSIAAAKGVTLPQFRMLVVLSQASANLTALAAGLDVAPSTAMRMVDRLEPGGAATSPLSCVSSPWTNRPHWPTR
jgi:hypothetical protein